MTMTLEDDLIQINNLIDKKELEFKKIQDELSILKIDKYNKELELRKQNCIRQIKEFVATNGNILNRELHNELRLKLIKILHDEGDYCSSYDKVLHLILNKLGVKHQYLEEKDGNTKWSLLKIELD